jgi:hypothetical protein
VHLGHQLQVLGPKKSYTLCLAVIWFLTMAFLLSEGMQFLRSQGWVDVSVSLCAHPSDQGKWAQTVPQSFPMHEQHSGWEDLECKVRALQIRAKLKRGIAFFGLIGGVFRPLGWLSRA